MAEKQKTALSDKKMMMRAIKDSFIKLKPKTQEMCIRDRY